MKIERRSNMKYDYYGRAIPETAEEEAESARLAREAVARGIEEYKKMHDTLYETIGLEPLIRPLMSTGRVIIPSEEEIPKYPEITCILEDGEEFVISLEPHRAEFWTICGGKLWYMGVCKGRIKEMNQRWSLKEIYCGSK